MQAPSLTDISVVVLSHNRRSDLLRHLEELCAQQVRSGFELIVVDNASSDGTPADLRAFKQRFPEMQLLLQNENVGVAQGRNHGWRAATRRFILTLDDDTAIDLDGMVELRRIVLTQEKVGIVTPRIMDIPTGRCLNDYVFTVQEPSTFAGACHLVRHEMLERVGELDPDCDFGGEELDYSIRARKCGFTTVATPEAIAIHRSVARTTEGGRRRRERWCYNYARILFKHFPVGLALLLAGRVLVSQLVSGVRTCGLGLGLPLIRQTLRGALAGRRQHAPLAPSVLHFYRNPRLVPDFGNIHLWEKFLRQLRRRS